VAKHGPGETVYLIEFGDHAASEATTIELP
jgi:hypothetical protein